MTAACRDDEYTNMHVKKVRLSSVLCIEVSIVAHLSAAVGYWTVNEEGLILDPLFLLSWKETPETGAVLEDPLKVAVFALAPP